VGLAAGSSWLWIAYTNQNPNLEGASRLVMVLQTAMPPAFSTLILAEIYHLDRDFSVAAVVGGSLGLLLLLPLWLGLFGV
jgi:malate permease and related proteins